jgi:hypothetical protein
MPGAFKRIWLTILLGLVIFFLLVSMAYGLGLLT